MLNRGAYVRRALQYLRPSPVIARAISAAVVIALTACAGQEQTRFASNAGGQLYARVLDEIGELFIEPVSSRRVAISGAARLARLDNKLAVSDGLGGVGGGTIALSYEDRNLAFYATPADKDN